MTGKLKACGTWVPHKFKKGERTLSERSLRTLSCSACSSEMAAEAVLCLRWYHKEGGLVQSARLSSRNRCVAEEESGGLHVRVLTCSKGHVRRCFWLWRRNTRPVRAPQAFRVQAERDLSWPIALERPEGEMGSLKIFLLLKKMLSEPCYRQRDRSLPRLEGIASL